MKTLKLKYSFPLLFLFTMFFSVSAWGVLAPFTTVNPDNTKDIQGNYAIAGNTVMCLTEHNDQYGGSCQDTGYEEITSNMHYSQYIDIDSDSSTWNSTSSYITLPATLDTASGNPILWAGLFWQGRIIHNDNTLDLRYAKENASGGYDLITTSDGSQGDVDFSTTGAYNMKLKVDNGSYSDVTKATFYTTGSTTAKSYAAYADVTSIVQPAIQTDGKHTFTVANLTTNEGRESGTGVTGGWSLVVIYAEDSFGKMRNISIYSGFDSVSNPSTAFTITDFLLPKENTVNATLSLFSGEGEYLYGAKPSTPNNYDWIKISNDGSTYTSMPNAIHPNNVFDSRFTGVTRDDIAGHSNNLQINNVGIDIDSFDVSSLMTTYRDINPDLDTMYIQWSSDWDYITPSMIAFSTELYVPEFCYDYAYKQQGKYFTEKNDGTQNPRIVGDVLRYEEIEVTLFLRNLVASDIEVKDLYFNITDINATQAPYILGTTSMAQVPQIIPTPISDSGTTTQTNITDIRIGDMGSNDYFYIYYKLDPKKSSLDMPINATASYYLELDSGNTIEYALKLGSHINICKNSNYDYQPVEGRFNLVHADYYTWNGSSGNRYYNLPTQITSREGNFKIISMDPDNLNDIQALPENTKVAIELIDVSSFHDTFTACKELESAITPRIWVTIDANTSSSPFNEATLAQAAITAGATYGTLDNGWDFYKTANENTAFRISYNLDDNESFILQFSEDTSTDPSKYLILNFPGAAKTGECSHPVNFFSLQGNLKTNVTQAATACGNAGTEISESQFDACNECLYGKNTALICSRDNFSIRPEALLIKLDDQNQTNMSFYQRLDEDGLGIISGVTAPTDRVLNMAAGYRYHMEVNATNHRGNGSSPGYTKTYGIINDDKAHFIWDNNISACNDQSNHEFEIRFLEGYVDTNISIDEVGRYQLNKTDKEWTTVDYDKEHMKHHTGSYFLNDDTPDCILDSAITQTVNGTSGGASPMQGCEIHSEHDSSSSFELKYRNYKIEFHPYDFNLSTIIPTVGLNHTPVTSTSYVYMSKFNSGQDQNMSYHLNGFIIPQGYNKSTLSNFVEGCFAKALDINISNDGTGLTYDDGSQVIYQSRFHDINTTTGSVIRETNTALTLDTNYTTPTSLIRVATPQNYFKKDFNGVMDTRLNLNYNKEINIVVNPKEISFKRYDVGCENPTNNCNFKADMIDDKKTFGTKDLNSTINIKHYYGRTHSPRYRFVGPTGNAFIYYEVYCNGTGCNKTLLQNRADGQSGLNSRVIDDPRWFINELHTVADYGNPGNVTQKDATRITSGALDFNTTGQTAAPLTYDETRGYPYKATMENNSSRWLIYNRFDADDNTTEFEVEFVNSNRNWAGARETTNTTDDTAASKTNRRSMW